MTDTWESRDTALDRHLLWLALAVAVAWALVLPQLRPLLPVDETRYLTVAWEMHGTGSYIVPHLNGEIYTHKPPLLFWLINLVWSLTGVSEGAARLVGPAFGVIAVALTWHLGRLLRPGQPETAGRAALILASTGLFALYGSMTMFDTMLTCAVLLGVSGLIRLDGGANRAGIATLGVALALGVFAKGPVILVHLMPLALARPLWSVAPDRGPYVAWLGRIAAAILVALVIVGLWLGPALLFGGEDYRNDVLWRQSAGRMVNAFDHARPVWFFLAALPLVLWPWFWRLPALRSLSPRTVLQDPRARLLTIWFVATVLLFSLISGKQLHYLLPALPAAALLLAAAPSPRPGFGPSIVSAVVLLPVLIWVVLLAFGKAHIDGVPVPAPSAWPLPLILVLAAALLAALAAMGRRMPMLAWALVAPATLAVVHLALGGALAEFYNPGLFAAEIGRDPAAGIAFVGGRYQGEFGFAARLTQPVILPTEAELASWAAAHPGGLVITAKPMDLPWPIVLEGHFAGDLLHLYRLPPS